MAAATLTATTTPSATTTTPPAATQGTSQQEYVAVTMESLQDSQPATIALGLVLGYFAFGVLFYWQATDWSLLQAAYFVIITVTSVGYGDLTPSGEGIRLFTAAYILFGVGIVGTALGEVVSSLLDVDATPAGRMIKWLSGGGRGQQTPEALEAADGGEPSELDQLLGGDDAKSTLLSTLGTVTACLVLGTAAFLRLEPGLSPIDALYYAVVTVTTVGYGDLTPQTDASQAFVSIYALFGTILLARSLGAIAALPLERRRLHQQRIVLEQYGGELDAEELSDLQDTLVSMNLCDSERGYCTRSDFALAMLVRQDKVTRADVDLVLETFAKLDIDGSGELDEGDVAAWLERAPTA